MIFFYTFAGKRKTQCQYKKKVNRAGARVKKLVNYNELVLQIYGFCLFLLSLCIFKLFEN
jgi:hypothetical protein